MTKLQQYSTYLEIRSQGRALDAILRRLDELPVNLPDFDQVIFTGCGSSLYLSQVAAWVWGERLGVPCRTVASSEILLNPDHYLGRSRRTIVFALSRTGETSETVRAAQLIRDRFKFPVIPVTCYGDSSLGRLVSEALVFPEVEEDSVVMTRAFVGILGAFLKFSAPEAALSSIPEWIDESLDRNEEAVAQLAQIDFQTAIFLGTGPFTYLSREAMLKVEEMTGRPTKSAQTFEFRHGPKAILKEDCLVWIFAARSDFDYLPELIADLTQLNAKLCLVGNRLPPHLLPLVPYSFPVDWPAERSETEGLGLLHLAQLYAFFRSLELGNNPDRPAKLSRVIRIQ